MMYLFHVTTIDNFELIMKDDSLKSVNLLKKEGKNVSLNEGNGIYKTNNFVYFSCVNKLFNKNILSNEVILYFDTKLLYQNIFYVSTMHLDFPAYLYEGNNGGKEEYKRKYNKHYKLYNLVLKKLYKHSISLLENGKSFQIFQQIAVRHKVNLKKYLVAIEIRNIKGKNISELIDYIKNNYENVIIKYNKY